MKDNFEYKRQQKQKKKQKLLLKELQSTEHGECIDGDHWETIDMKKQLHPIGYYINDREEMIRQLFTVIHGERLKKMLPPILKDVDLDELKADCLIHLVGMSSKRIKAILEGQDLDASSNESDSDDDTDSVMAAEDSTKNSLTATRPSVSMSNTKQLLDDSCSADDTLEIEIGESNYDFFGSNDDLVSPRNKHKKLKRKHHEQTVRHENPCVDVRNLQVGVEHDLSELSSGVNDSVYKKDENKGKTLLEILELEMRARAIRAILQRDNKDPSPTAALQEEKETSIDSNSCCRAESSSQLPTETELRGLEAGEDCEILDSVETDESVCRDVKQQEVDLNLISNDGKSDTKTKESNDSGNENDDNNDDVMIIESGGSSWAQRWLEKKSKDVKRLVSTSKMCTTIRNKMKKSKLSSDPPSMTNKYSQDHLMPSEFKGSIDEYKMLTKITPNLQLSEQDTSPSDSTKIQIRSSEETEGSIALDHC